MLIDFDHSIFSRAAFMDGKGSVLPRDVTGRSLKTRLRRVLLGSNPVAPRLCRKLIGLAKAAAAEPLILIVGGGAVGLGLEAMYSDPSIRVIGTDVYVSCNTRAAVDGHQLPFESGTFDAVWIQAVLEHVLNPQKVVDEIHRVLKPGGLVYADTPFMQQVHEGAYDFMRFTQSGHRWLLRNFREIEAGPVDGAGASLLWSMGYFVRALGAGRVIVTLTQFAFFWLRLFEPFMDRKKNADGASGTYFLGARSDCELKPKQMIEYYAQQSLQRG